MATCTFGCSQVSYSSTVTGSRLGSLPRWDVRRSRSGLAGGSASATIASMNRLNVAPNSAGESASGMGGLSPRRAAGGHLDQRPLFQAASPSPGFAGYSPDSAGGESLWPLPRLPGARVSQPPGPLSGLPWSSVVIWLSWLLTGEPSPGYRMTGVPTSAQLNRNCSFPNGT